MLFFHVMPTQIMLEYIGRRSCRDIFLWKERKKFKFNPIKRRGKAVMDKKGIKMAEMEDFSSGLGL